MSRLLTYANCRRRGQCWRRACQIRCRLRFAIQTRSILRLSTKELGHRKFLSNMQCVHIQVDPMQEERGCTWRIVTLGTGDFAELSARHLDSNPIKVHVTCGIRFLTKAHSVAKRPRCIRTRLTIQALLAWVCHLAPISIRLAS